MNELAVPWPVRTLASLGTYLNGFAFKPHHWGETGHPIVRIRELLDSTVEPDRYSGNSAEMFKIEDGDLIFSWSATLATLFWNRGPAYLNQHLFKVTASSDVDLLFLHHLINFNLDSLAARSHGTTMKHITRGDLADYVVRLPALPEQRRIAEILDALDDQIRATQQIIAKLKLVRIGLIEDLLSRQININPVGPLKKWLAAKPKNGYSPVAVDQWSGISMLGLGCISAEGFAPNQLKNAPSQDPRLRAARLEGGDLLMTRANTRDLVGFAGIYRDIGHLCTYPDLMMRLKPVPEVSTEYLEILLNSASIRRQVKNLASGTSGSMVKISGKIVENLHVSMPRLDVQLDIVKQVGSIRSTSNAETARLNKLLALKIGLRSDLLTGKLRVPMEPTP